MLAATPLETAQTILVVDDSPEVRRSIERMLRGLGFEAVGVANGLEAIESVRSSVPDLVLCDLRMPVMDGLQLLARLQVSHPDLPVIVMSGAGLLDDAIGALKLGAWGYVEKPITTIEALQHTLRSALERGALLTENAQQRARLEAANRELVTTLRLFFADEEAGRQIQFRMLPRNHHAFGRYEMSRDLIPSAILSGDFIDAFAIDAQRWGFYLADVSGHGVSSAFVTVVLRTGVQRVLENFPNDDRILSPARLLAHINDELFKEDLEKHATLFYGVIDDAAGTLTYANAGHFPWPLLYDGSHVTALEQPGIPVGLLPDPRYEEHTLVLPENAQLAVFSDGLLEVLPQTTLAAKQSFLAALFGREGVTLDQVRAELRLTDRAPLPDDIAMLLIKKRGGDDDGRIIRRA